MSAIATLLLAAVAAVATSSLPPNAPSQIHAHLTGNDSSIVVTWSVPASCGAACAAVVAVRAVNSSASPAAWRNYTSVVSVATLDASMGSAQGWTVTSVVLSGLPLNATSYYACGGLVSGGPVLALRPGRLRRAGDRTPTVLPHDYNAAAPPLRIVAALADIGLANSLSLPLLLNDSAAGVFDVLLLAGDLAYDLSTTSGAVGDAFMAALQPVFGSQPLVLGPGNHECASSGASAGTAAPLGCFESYTRRFAGVGATAGATSRSGTNHWYSVNDVGAGVHYVVMSSELWFYTGSADNITAQYLWLQNDLIAVNRTLTPWVIALSHKQTWHDSTNFTIMERILNAGRVDLLFVGHQHNSARLFPLDGFAGTHETACVSPDRRVYRDCHNMTTLVVGGPGNREGITTSALAASSTAWQGYAYGYSYLYVANRTHLYWKFVQTANMSGNATLPGDPTAISDEFYLVKTTEKALALPLVIPGALEATPTSAPTGTPTGSTTRSGTATRSHTRTGTPAMTDTGTASPSGSASSSASPTPTRTPSPSDTVFPSASVAGTRSPTRTPAATLTTTPSSPSTASHTRSSVASRSHTRTGSISASVSDTSTASGSASASASGSGTVEATPSPSGSVTPASTGTPVPSPLLTPSLTPTGSDSSSATASRSPPPSAPPSPTPPPTVSPSPTPSRVSTSRTPSRSPTSSRSASRTATTSPTASRSGSATKTQTPTHTSTPSPTRSGSLTSSTTRSGSVTLSGTRSARPTPSGTKTASASRKAKRRRVEAVRG